MSFSTLNLLLLLMLIILIWRDNLKVREMATKISRSACQSHGLQFLDQTVALRRMGISWGPSGLKLRRIYEFDYSQEGSGRLTGYIVMLGSHSETLRIEPPEVGDKINH